MGKNEKADYFYASGKRVPLARATDYFALSSDSLTLAGLSSTAQGHLKELGLPLRGGIFLYRWSELTENIRAEVEKKCVIHPVYLHQDTLLVVLPEIRVEETRPDHKKRLKDWLNRHKDAEVVRERSQGVVLRPASGSGKTALTLANQLQEEVGPELAQARFIRIVERPTHKGED
jgi:hypothetical protein